MDIREKLVELICRFCSGLAVSDITPPYGYENLADFMISNGVTVQEDCKDCAVATQNCIVKLQEHISELRSAQEWISVDDRMPTQEDAPTEYVFTAYKNQNCYDVEIALWDTVIAYPDLYDYWMALPLPQPPKGE